MKSIRLFIMIVMSFLLCINSSVAGEQQEKIPQQYYDTIESRLEQIQIGNEVLRVLTTSELVQLALNYPLLGDCFLYDDGTQAMLYLQRTANVFKELFSRGDAIPVLLEAYANLKVDYKQMVDKQLDFIESNYVQEFFLQRYFATVSTQLTDEQMVHLERILEEKYQQKIGICDNYLTAHQYYYDVQKNVVNNQEDVVFFTGRPLSLATYTAGFTYLSGTTTRSGIQYYLGTYGKYNVTSFCLKHKSGDYTTSEKNAMNSTILSIHPSWVLVFSATAKYNCHSYAWIQTSSSNVYWLDSPTTFSSSSAFRYIGSDCAVSTNDKIIIVDYRGDVQHSAIIYNNSELTYSKLGSAGVYLVDLSELVLYYGCEYKVYRER